MCNRLTPCARSGPPGAGFEKPDRNYNRKKTARLILHFHQNVTESSLPFLHIIYHTVQFLPSQPYRESVCWLNWKLIKLRLCPEILKTLFFVHVNLITVFENKRFETEEVKQGFCPPSCSFWARCLSTFLSFARVGGIWWFNIVWAWAPSYNWKWGCKISLWQARGGLESPFMAEHFNLMNTCTWHFLQYSAFKYWPIKLLFSPQSSVWSMIDNYYKNIYESINSVQFTPCKDE